MKGAFVSPECLQIPDYFVLRLSVGAPADILTHKVPIAITKQILYSMKHNTVLALPILVSALNPEF